MTQPIRSRVAWLGLLALAGAAPTEAPTKAPADVDAILRRVADYQLAQVGPKPSVAEVWAVTYDGLLAVSRVTGDPKYRDAVAKIAEQTGYKPGPRPFNADDQAICLVYLDLYQTQETDAPNEKILAPTKAAMDRLLAHPTTQPLEFGKPDPKHWNDRWSWCDALYMAPPVLAKLAVITHNPKYTAYLDAEWAHTSDYLFDPASNLYFRDSRFFDRKTAHGKKVFWSRANGWVYAGLAHVLRSLPKDDPSRPKYVDWFKRMTPAIVAAQQPDGLWRSSLLDPSEFPTPEMSGSSFYTFGLAFGVNDGILSEQTYWPIVRKAWASMVKKVDPAGKVTSIQPSGDRPAKFSDDSWTPIGAGAFLLAGSEVYRHDAPERGR
jgi:rhamnogalacturonyl hydrolase YesR